MVRASSNQKVKYPIISTRTWLFLYIIAFILLCFFTYTIWQQQANDRYGQRVSNTLSWYREQKAVFCYDRRIVPCTDDKIVDWNTGHVNDAFAIKTNEEVLKDARVQP